MVCHAEPKVFIPHDHLYSAKMSRPRTCGWCRIGHILFLYVIAAFPAATIFVQSASLSTNFSFPVFPAPDDFISFGETRYNPDTLSFIVDPIPSGLLTRRLFCVKLLYANKLRLKNGDSSSVASFITSFTFSITQKEQFTNRSGWEGHACGFTFSFASENISTLFAGLVDPANSGAVNYFAVEFDTYNSYADEDPSDNHIGININNFKSAHTYNLCGGNRTTCSFPWTGRTYTAWIDYNGSTRSLEVWFVNGSLTEGVIKPAGSGLIKVPELDLMETFEDYMYVGFSGNTGPFLDIYEILSWNLETSFAEEDMPTLTPMRSRPFSKGILVICAACATAILAAACLLGYRTRQPHANKASELEPDLLMGLRRFTFKVLKKATNNFNEGALLGKGGSGSVYKGTLTPSGMVVAVKRLKHDSEHVQREFLAEVSSISQIRHRNLVQLQGWCHEDGHFLLVFDYMSNGSLDEWLFPSRRRHPRDPKYKTFEVLPWKMRFSILAGVAAAVEYLHEEWVLHRGIKSSNVMLDADFNPHLGDFGPPRLMDHGKLEKTTMMAGTFGYMAPEMHYTGKATKESDVYSFGILILEVVCGRRAVNLQVEDPDEDFMLLQAVWRAYEGGNMLSAVDPGLLNVHSQQAKPFSNWTAASYETTQPTDSTHERVLINEVGPNIASPVVLTGATMNFGEVDRVVTLLHLGLQCCLLDPEFRPSMRVVKQVIMQLQGSTAEEDPVSALKWMPPLPSTMPLHGDLQPTSSLRVPIASIGATKAGLQDVEAWLAPEISSHGGVRRRIVTN